MRRWDQLADDEAIQTTSKALGANGIKTLVFEKGAEAKSKVLEIIPKGAEVMDMTSATLETINLRETIQESGNYDSIKAKLKSMNRETQGKEMNRLGAAPDWAIGSVHAVTQDGKVVVASNTGSQFGAYSYGAQNVIWVVGAQKIVKNLEEAILRIYEHCLPLESERMMKLRGIPSNVSKLLIINKEVKQGRATLMIVKEALGF